MRLIDLYFQAFRVFREHTKDNPESLKNRKVIMHANANADKLTSIKYTCTIEEDWVANIEEGLIHIEKAIREERQFIRSEGEVVPIEKAKSTSKATVRHLARHSDFITRMPEKKGDPIIPDKLYMEEKLSDYAVYENRFLYMLLCYLRDFIQMRIEKIRDKVTTYKADISIDKEIRMNNRHINYQLDYLDINKNDPYLVEAYEKTPLVDRVEIIFSQVLSFLSTPLMQEVAKVPMLKPPIVKTNVLRMNQNFKAAMELYDYITSYNQAGYSFEEIKKTFSPFPNEMSDEIAETIELQSFIAYSFGNEIGTDLKETYSALIEKIKAQENKQAIEEIKRLKKRLDEMDEDPAEYILTLEKRNRSLENDRFDLAVEKEKNAEYQEQITNLEKEKESLNNKAKQLEINLSQKDEEIIKLNQKHLDDIVQTEEVHQSEMKALVERTNARIIQLREEHQQEVAELNSQHSNKITQLRDSYEAEMQNAANKFEEIIDNLNTEINNYQEKVQTLNNEKAELSMEFEKAAKAYEKQIKDLENKVKYHQDETRYVNARLNALKHDKGLLTEEEDFTSKEKFKELELEMNAYKNFFKEQWKKTKVKIRKKVKQEVESK